MLQVPLARADDQGRGAYSDSVLLPVSVEQSVHGSHDLSVETKQILKEVHSELSLVVPLTEQVHMPIHQVSRQQFFGSIGAPRWASAYFVGGEVYLPLMDNRTDGERLRRSLRHEYTHVAIAAASSGRAAAWIDEGLAQLMEGDAHPRVMAATGKYIRRYGPLAFTRLREGFTDLRSSMVPVAYGQSYVAVKLLLDEFGSRGFRTYFEGLHLGQSHDEAFESAGVVGDDEVAAVGVLAAHLLLFPVGTPDRRAHAGAACRYQR